MSLTKNDITAKQLDNEHVLYSATVNGITVNHIQLIDNQIDVDAMERSIKIQRVNTLPSVMNRVINDRSNDISKKLNGLNASAVGKQ